MNFPGILELAGAVEHAALIIRERFSLPHKISHKEDNTPVTQTDIEVNQILAHYASREWQIGFIGEEGNGNTNHQYHLYVDPLDGTGAYTRGMATATTIASIMEDGLPIMAVIHNPITMQTWMAERNQGCRYRRFEQELTTTFVSTAYPNYWRTAICAWPGVDEPFARFKKAVLESKQFSDQEMGAFGIGGGLIASGTLHATAISATSAVESAAMSLIVREAGGVTIDLLGNPLETFELGEHKGKADFLLPHGAIFACSAEAASALSELYKTV